MREIRMLAYDEAEVGDGVKERTEAPDNGESLRQTAIPRPCGHRAQLSTLLVSDSERNPWPVCKPVAGPTCVAGNGRV